GRRERGPFLTRVRRPRREEPKMAPPSCPAPQAAERGTETPAREPRQAERGPERPADGLHPGPGTARHPPRAAAPAEKPDVKQKSTKRKFVIPQIIITRASNESLVSYSSSRSEEQRTIREPEDWGPYRRHRTPSTADAYDLHIKE
uniref:Spermatogenesis associated 33 n=1 Tax=Cebus imitator TaxID=2715852 RepID=A0A2K5Q1D3_CEBIM